MILKEKSAMTGLKRFQQHLHELFQLDNTADLDFGIYRLFSARRAEVKKYGAKSKGQEAVLKHAVYTILNNIMWQVEYKAT